jgi:hypothetical protein
MFRLAVKSFGLQPSEFWDMTLPEFYEVYRAHTEQDKGRGLSQAEIDAELAWLRGETE